MNLDQLPALAASLAAAWGLLHAPGLMAVGRCRGGVPALFAQVLASAVVTTLAATGLAALGAFSLGAVLATSLLAGAALAAVRLSRRSRLPADEPPPRPGGGAWLAAIVPLALLSYWPAWPAFLGSSDSTAYLVTGVSLAHHGHLWRKDELGPDLPPAAREALFDSMSQVFASAGPPYRRMPGALLLRSLEDDRAWPAFFPVPSVWAALLVEAAPSGSASAEQAAPNYAPLFASLALWAFALLARTWIGTGPALLATATLGASAAFYNAARLPLSEPIAAFFALGGLAVLAAAPARPLAAPVAVLAASALGAAVFTRVETALWMAMAMAMAPTLAPGRGLGLPRAFVGTLAAFAAMTALEATLVPGSWVDPLVDHARNVRQALVLEWRSDHGAFAMAAAAGAAVLVVAARRWGWSAVLRWSFVAAVLAGHGYGSNFLWDRTPMWLSFSIGWSGLALAAAGAAAAFVRRDGLPAAPLLLAAAASVALLLFYNPHVYPALPWGSRRYVPLLLPMLVLLAFHALAVVSSRSRVAAALGAALLASAVASGGRPLWGREILAGSWEALAAIDAAIPEGGVVLYDRDISSMMVGPAMWMVHDRQGLPVAPADSRPGREWIPAITWQASLAGRGPVWLVTRATATTVQPPKVRMTRVAHLPLVLPFIEQTYDRAPRRQENYAMPLAVWRLEPSLSQRTQVLR